MSSNQTRSQLELRNYKILERAGVTFEYETEACQFNYIMPIRGGHCFDCDGSHVGSTHLYTCDFLVTTKGTGKQIYIECKGNGYMWTGSTRSKHLQIKKQFPEADLRFVFGNPNAKISKGAKLTNKDWCSRHGFICAPRDVIPQEWLNE